MVLPYANLYPACMKPRKISFGMSLTVVTYNPLIRASGTIYRIRYPATEIFIGDDFNLELLT